MEKETYNRSRMLINEYITHTCTKHYTKDNKLLPDNVFFNTINGFIQYGNIPPIGSLCRLLFTDSNKYYLSWFLGMNEHRYILQSIEDHEICEWSNCSIEHIPIDFKKTHPQFFYSDSQFAFQDKWDDIVKTTNYWLIPMFTEFSNKTNEIKLCMRWKFSNEKIERSFKSWKTITDEEMKAFTNDVLKDRIKKL